MNKNMIALGAAILLTAGGLVGPPAAAADNGGAGVFAGINAGTANAHVDGSSFNKLSYGINAGYRWAINDKNSLGFGIGYHRVDKITESLVMPYSGAIISAAGTIKPSILTFGLNYNAAFSEAASGSVVWIMRAGYARAHVTEHATAVGSGPFINPVFAEISVSDNLDGWYGGVGLGYRFSNQLMISANYSYYRFSESGEHPHAGIATARIGYSF